MAQTQHVQKSSAATLFTLIAEQQSVQWRRYMHICA